MILALFFGLISMRAQAIVQVESIYVEEFARRYAVDIAKIPKVQLKHVGNAISARFGGMPAVKIEIVRIELDVEKIALVWKLNGREERIEDRNMKQSRYLPFLPFFLETALAEPIEVNGSPGWFRQTLLTKWGSLAGAYRASPSLRTIAKYLLPEEDRRKLKIAGEIHESEAGVHYGNAFTQKCMQYVNYFLKNCDARKKLSGDAVLEGQTILDELNIKLRWVPKAYVKGAGRLGFQVGAKKVVGWASTSRAEALNEAESAGAIGFLEEAAKFDVGVGAGVDNFQNAMAKKYQRVSTNYAQQFKCVSRSGGPRIDEELKPCLAKLISKPAEQKADPAPEVLTGGVL